MSNPVASLSQRPVRDTTPTIIPAIEQAMATPIVFFAPFSKASRNDVRLILVSFLNILTIIDAIIA